MPVCAHINVLPSTSSSMQKSLYQCVCRAVGALPWWRGHRAKMSMESGNRAVWIINRDGCARPPACKSNKMLPLAEPSRCNMAMKAGYPSREGGLEPCYGESISKPTLPNINLCDGSIDFLCLCVYLGMYLLVCAHEKGRKRQVSVWQTCVAQRCVLLSHGAEGRPAHSYRALSDVM